MPEKDKLDLACGNRKASGEWLGLDKRNTPDQDIQHDLEENPELPFPDNCFKKVRASHIVEHLSENTYFLLMQEMARVCEPDGEVIVIVPHFLSWNSHDPDHEREFSKISMNAFSIQHQFPTDTPQPFEEVSHEYKFNESYIVDLFIRFLGERRTAKFLPNAVDEIKFTLKPYSVDSRLSSGEEEE